MKRALSILGFGGPWHPSGSIAGSSRRLRLFHVLWATLIAGALAAALLLEPIDWLVWNVQSRVSDQAASGEVVFLQTDESIADPQSPAQRVQLAQALDRLHAAGVERVFIDVVFSRAAESAAADARLQRALERWGPRVAFVNRIDTAKQGDAAEFRTLAALTSGRTVVWNGFTSEWPGFTWRMPYRYRTTTGSQRSFAAALARVDAAPDADFEVQYNIRSRSIATLSFATLDEIRTTPNAPSLVGKTVVIGIPAGGTSTELLVPGQISSPPSFVPIMASETLKRGPPSFIPGLQSVLIMALLLSAGALSKTALLRRTAYACALLLPVYAALVAPGLALRLELSYCIPLLLVFGLLRWRTNWKQRVALIEQNTGLPSLRALALHLAERREFTGHVVVAKIHGYETILRSLDTRHRAAYILKLVERLRVGDPKMTVYVEGHYLAWPSDHKDQQKLREHLEGLRAIFAAPVTVDSHSIDVGITFGAAAAESANPERYLAAALAAVEETSEALEPVKIADSAGDADSLWDLSLRARIDAAMEAGEVYCVYQPKVDISVDRIVGVEALVRWEDPERGFIPPLHFVMQCEKAGRMEYLTRYVLQSACSAGRLLHFRGSRITMSVNISATLLNDMRIVGIVRNVLQATDFDPNYLVLEITETARIRDLAHARSVLKALKALGTHLSMDDFGVGAANFETLQALPFDEIKIDRTFVAAGATSSKARAITASIVGLGKNARIAVVAEGAETEADLQMLREIGCWEVQGYALARPMPLTNLLTFIDGGGRRVQTATN